MCLFPRLIRNRKYTANKKNGGVIPPVSDIRVLQVPVGCGKCIECVKQKGRAWQVRLLEEVKNNKSGKFVTLTFSDKSIAKLSKEKSLKNLEGYNLDNGIATLATRRFLERCRKKYKKSIRHFLITELGHNGTENIHLHGILFTDKPMQEIRELWGYGYAWIGTEEKGKEITNYVNERTVNYITKYITKMDEEHKEYKPKILCTGGIGRGYKDSVNAQRNNYKGIQTKQTYTTKTGHEIALPTYYRNQLYSEEEREKLWIDLLDKQERWVCGERIDISNGDELYYNVLNWHRARNKQLGYGDDSIDWNKRAYENERRKLKIQERIERAEKAPRFAWGGLGKDKED